MPKYYCDYCKSYLTHDKTSVRKSHLSGKNHIRLYCSYYETKAKQLGIWDPSETKYHVDLAYLASPAPGPEEFATKKQREKEKLLVKRAEDNQQPFCIPPPPTLRGMPAPPPSAFRFSEEYNHLIEVHMDRLETII